MNPSKGGYVYIMTNQNNSVLYTGVTSNIIQRVAEHKAKIKKGFTSKYNCSKLVYYEYYPAIELAISVEKKIKRWKRSWKEELIESINNNWLDLSIELGVNQEAVESIKTHYLGCSRK